ncbi:hypothetical protein P154DRAFT_602884 [Amniculicola lignicola CBS 123094]|uniref:Uncharacterized protein n=1 Tax=Amniculicola lignicola CBS 123094 TaxID=1392246 RepID=A0A6A5WCD0_9PLEO|nr:hypothetical protein P154DRAFT_602884 [Amniculicola lignicola CBS 123094]
MDIPNMLNPNPGFDYQELEEERIEGAHGGNFHLAQDNPPFFLPNPPRGAFGIRRVETLPPPYVQIEVNADIGDQSSDGSNTPTVPNTPRSPGTPTASLAPSQANAPPASGVGQDERPQLAAQPVTRAEILTEIRQNWGLRDGARIVLERIAPRDERYRVPLEIADWQPGVVAGLLDLSRLEANYFHVTQDLEDRVHDREYLDRANGRALRPDHVLLEDVEYVRDVYEEERRYRQHLDEVAQEAQAEPRGAPKRARVRGEQDEDRDVASRSRESGRPRLNEPDAPLSVAARPRFRAKGSAVRRQPRPASLVPTIQAGDVQPSYSASSAGVELGPPTLSGFTFRVRHPVPMGATFDERIQLLRLQQDMERDDEGGALDLANRGLHLGETEEQRKASREHRKRQNALEYEIKCLEIEKRVKEEQDRQNG